MHRFSVDFIDGDYEEIIIVISFFRNSLSDSLFNFSFIGVHPVRLSSWVSLMFSYQIICTFSKYNVQLQYLSWHNI